jgi:hypothetical protein
MNCIEVFVEMIIQSLLVKLGEVNGSDGLELRFEGV